MKGYLKNILNSSLFRTSGIYTVTSVINAAIPFLLLPLLTEYLSKANFGLVAMYITLNGLLMPFIGFNMEGAISRKFYSDSENIKEYIGNCLIISVLNFFIVFIICLFFFSIIQQFTGLSEKWILFAVVQCFFQFIISVYLTVNQVKVKPLLYGAVQIIQSILNFGLSAILIIYFEYGWEGRLIAAIFSSVSLGVFILLFFLLRGYFKINLNFNFIKHALSYGGGLLPHTLASFFIIYTNRFFLLKMVGIEETGLYSVASQVASIIGFITLSFNNAYVPWLYSKLNQNIETIRNEIVKITYFYFMILLTCGFIFYLSIPLFYKVLIDTKFDQSAKYTLWIILGFVFQGMYFMVTNYITYAEKTWYQAIITVCIALFNIPLNYYCINFFGPVGAAIAFTFSYFLLFVCTWIMSAKIYKMPWKII